MKKGFTLVELIAILAVIAVLAVILYPNINRAIEKSNEKALILSAENIIKTVENYGNTYRIDNNRKYKNVVIRIENHQFVDSDITVSGKLPESGEITIDDDENIALYIHDGKYCVAKGFLENNARSSVNTVENCNYNSNSSMATGSQSILTDSIEDSIKSITIYGNSVQETSAQSTNYCPPVTEWTLSGGAYIDSNGWLVLPNTNSSAYVDIRWDKAGTPFYFGGTAYATIEGSSYYFTTSYLDKNKTSLSGNGAAHAITLNTNYSFNASMGSTGTYAEALAQAIYVRLQVARNATHAPQEFKIKDIYAGPVRATTYTLFTPNKPSPDYPSEIYSVGTYNSTTGKYDVNIEVNHGNLFKNGYGELNNNTNFTSWTYNNESSSVPRKSFSVNSSAYGEHITSDYIKININKDYEMSIWARNNNQNVIYYVGFRPYDIAKNHVNPNSVMYTSNTLTELSEDLKNGDTIVKLNSVANFINPSNAPSYRLGLIFWNYRDSLGTIFSENTYSRNVWLGLYTYDNIFKTSTVKDGVTYPANTIKLTSAWDKEPFQQELKLVNLTLEILLIIA